MPMYRTLALVVALSTAACAQPAAPPAEPVATQAGAVEVVEVQGGLDHPWGIAFLPDGRALVTERPGRLRLIDLEAGGEPAVVAGTPEVYGRGQGGMLDVALDPDFQDNGYVYLTYAKPGRAAPRRPWGAASSRARR